MKTAKAHFTNWGATLLKEAGIEYTVQERQLKAGPVKYLVVKGDMNSMQLSDRLFSLLKIKQRNDPGFQPLD